MGWGGLGVCVWGGLTQILQPKIAHGCWQNHLRTTTASALLIPIFLWGSVETDRRGSASEQEWKLVPRTLLSSRKKAKCSSDHLKQGGGRKITFTVSKCVCFLNFTSYTIKVIIVMFCRTSGGIIVFNYINGKALKVASL